MQAGKRGECDEKAVHVNVSQLTDAKTMRDGQLNIAAAGGGDIRASRTARRCNGLRMSASVEIYLTAIQDRTWQLSCHHVRMAT